MIGTIGVIIQVRLIKKGDFYPSSKYESACTCMFTTPPFVRAWIKIMLLNFNQRYVTERISELFEQENNTYVSAVFEILMACLFS